MASSAEDRVISKILGVSLRLQDQAANILHLSDLAKELADEGSESPLLNKENMDRALMARLMTAPEPSSQSPLFYLLDMYGRASAELRSASSNRDAAVAQRLQDVACYAQELAISHANLALTMDVFPEDPSSQERGARQILDALEQRDGLGQMRSSSTAMPSGFLERFAEEYEQESLPGIVATLVGALNEELLKVSLMGEFSRPLQHLLLLASIPPIARAMTQLPNWAPAVQTGREVHTGTVLGAAFGVTSLPEEASDPLQPGPPSPEPNVATTLFSHAESRSAEANRGMESVRLTRQGLHTSQWNLVMAFLKPQATREAMLKWLALALESNKELRKEQPDPSKAAPRGFMLNLAAVMLKICDPFLEPAAGKAWGKLDVRYVEQSARLDYSDETRLHFTAQELQAYKEKLAEESASPPFSPHFICECYFMTAEALHLGYTQLFAHFQHYQRYLQKVKEAVQSARDMMEQSAHMPPMQLRVIELERQRLQGILDQVTGGFYCMYAELLDKQLTEQVAAFIRLTAVWLLREASPSYASGLAPEIPLPSPAVALRTLPEYIVSEVSQFLENALMYAEMGVALSPTFTETAILFITCFMSADEHINNIYVRAKLCQVLAFMLPEEEDADAESFLGRRRRSSPTFEVAAQILETSCPIQEVLVVSLQKLYAEVERTGRAHQYEEKQGLRLYFLRVVVYLWKSPTYREIWQRKSVEEGAIYSRFNFFLETDATYSLDEALKLLQEEREYEILPPIQQRSQEVTEHRRERVRGLRMHLEFAQLTLRVINMTSELIWQPWLEPQAVKRVAGTLNYFLKYLTGPQRRQLRVEDKDKEIKFDPKGLLKQIASIYINISKRDTQGAFSQAIVADKRSYYDDMFAEAIQLLHAFRLLPAGHMEELEHLARQTATDAQLLEGVEDTIEAEVPEEFLDPIMSDIMINPVTLPSGMNIDLETIKHHMMTDKTDPFNRVPITEEDLKPNDELKARIQAWKAEHTANRGNAMEE